jgi:heat-inducible transcriptional repressor
MSGVMLDERKTAILRAVVREYIETAQPVGSNHVVRAQGVNVSSATIRNEMAVLEQEGFLQQPHTSAGRVPTDKGYRYFVDHLTVPGQLDSQRSELVRDFFDTSHGALEKLLGDTSRLLAGLTDYAAVVIRPAAEAASIRSIQLVSLSARMATVVVVLSNGQVENEMIELADEISAAKVAAASAKLSSHAIGRTLESMGTVSTTGDPEVDAVAKACVRAFATSRRQSADLAFVGGASHMAQAFDAVDVVRNVLQALEHQHLVVGLLRSVLNRGLSVAIGAEHGVEPLAACAVVVKPYVVEGEPVGTIGVLGPTRMNYPRALAVVEAVSEQLGRTLTEN